ncbi:MAG: thioredoxin family protein [Phycisphaerales bacterium]
MSIATLKLPIIAAVVLAASSLTALQLFRGRVAPVPGAFAPAQRLPEALAQSATSGKPVLAFATADWCGPCQAFKRGALAHPKVAEWITANTIPVYIDIDTHAADARQLAVYSIPALVLIRPDGSRPSRFEGNRSAEDLLAFLTATR